jgi:hypothetical protein
MKSYKTYKSYRTYASYVACLIFLVGCAEPEGSAELLPIPFKLHQTEASVLKQLDSAGYKVRDHIPNEQLGDSIPLAGLQGVTTYFFHPDGIWHGIFFSRNDSTFNDFKFLRTRMEMEYGNAIELIQHPQNKQGYAVWKLNHGDVRVVRLTASRGIVQLFIADSSAVNVDPAGE